MKQHLRIHKAEPNRGILDYSHLLDAPAGKHGFVKIYVISNAVLTIDHQNALVLKSRMIFAPI